eukprot:gene24123-30433_t
MSIDTGSGTVKLNGEIGIRVADIINDLVHTINVFSTARTQLIYNDETNLMISGTGFNPVGTNLRFTGNEIQVNVNYTTLSINSDFITLRLTPGSNWIKQTESLPAPLTLLAVNTGEGFVAVSSPGAAADMIKGVDVAMVVEEPTVFSDNKKLFRTQSNKLLIKGRRFPSDKSGCRAIMLIFTEDSLVCDVDYTLRIVSSAELELTLLDGRAWRADAGPLKLVAINTRGDGAGWVVLPGGGVQVAEVQDDIDGDFQVGVEVFPVGVRVYQSALNQKIQITGTGFKQGILFIFEPDMKVGVDYEMEVVSKNRVTLSLKTGKKWRHETGNIIAKSTTVDKKTYNLAGKEGIRVAIVLKDPLIFASAASVYHESQSKVITIRGAGFTNAADTKVIIRPTAPGAYKVLSVSKDVIRVQLKPDQDWLPSFMSLKDEDDAKKIAMQISSIDTGAGEVTFPEPVTVGYIVKDRSDVVCDDSCKFAFNDVCDDDLQLSANNHYYASSVTSTNACLAGTDCTDCGGVEMLRAKSAQPSAAPTAKQSSPPYNDLLARCSNSCIYPRDGVCDDARGTHFCELNTDCQDCGPVGADNFTLSFNDEEWDDDKFDAHPPSDGVIAPLQAPYSPPPYVSGDQKQHFGAIFAVLCIIFAFLVPIYGAYKLFQWWHARGMKQMTRYAKLSMETQTSKDSVDLEMAPPLTEKRGKELKKGSIAPQEIVYVDE